MYNISHTHSVKHTIRSSDRLKESPNSLEEMEPVKLKGEVVYHRDRISRQDRNSITCHAHTHESLI